VTAKPRCLSHSEAASIPYAAMTAYSALTLWAGMRPGRRRGRRVLVVGAAGGVGHLALQVSAFNCTILFSTVECHYNVSCHNI